MSAIEFILSGMLAAATPFLLAALGELVAEKSGVMNLGLEGIMALGAVIGFICVYHGGPHLLAFLAAGVIGVLAALILAVLALEFRADQVAAGLAVGIFGQGLAALIGKPYESLTTTGLSQIAIPGLASLPMVGGLFKQDAVTWLTLIAALVIALVLSKSRLGLVIRAVGENPQAARAIGYPVIRIRYATVAFGGLMAGFAGAYAATVYTPMWADGMIAGRGWIALALVVFGTWVTGRVFAGALLFGALSLAELAAQAKGVHLPSQLLAAMPYLVTIIILGVISSNKLRMKRNSVASLGKPF
ncbi:ABC transporter permease [Paracoccus aminophilus]|uniref:ABC-type transport system, permease componentn n=1 Tax=Paracoccus aminophilus JCM 7686 TaxID=1367847 RepID=S5YFL9_PARAH|nr:ABC transporter permease [Paracoccus aminophilus]AGT10283.1 ABC-type transport system, permease componentn [Paracoccus aminophilus JCM 7686]